MAQNKRQMTESREHILPREVDPGKGQEETDRMKRNVDASGTRASSPEGL